MNTAAIFIQHARVNGLRKWKSNYLHHIEGFALLCYNNYSSTYISSVRAY
jgi:hypothetical protein